MASKKKGKNAGTVESRIRDLASSVAECLLECAEEADACLSACEEAGGGNGAARKCRIKCFQANRKCVRACRRKLDKMEDLLLAELVKEAKRA